MSKTDSKNILTTQAMRIGYKSKKGELCVAEALNISLKKGQLVCLLGSNGVGKSTLLRTLGGVQNPLSGSIRLHNRKLTDYSGLQRSGMIAMVLTERIPDSQMTVFELVASGRQPYTNWLGRLTDKDQEVVFNALKSVHMEKSARRKYFELSDGQLQKVMIARALAQDTDIIILDEPTAHLDIEHRISILKLLQKLTRTTQKTILAATHELPLALRLADTLWLMSAEGFYQSENNANMKKEWLYKICKPEVLDFYFDKCLRLSP